MLRCVYHMTKNPCSKYDLAFVFPGQGSQRVGMLQDLVEAYPVIRSTFAEASAVLGYDLWELSQAGTEDQLKEAEVTQPLMLAAGVSVWRAWQEGCQFEPVMLAGHSLGEYSALVASQSIQFHDAVELVRLRGRFMQAAVPLGQGAMLAILGLEDEVVDDLCRKVSDELHALNPDFEGKGQLVSGANYNAPGQVVVGGYKLAVDAVAKAAGLKGASKVVPVAMSTPSHCALMRPAAEALQPYLERLDISTPKIPIVANATGGLVKTTVEVRDALIQQISNPVYWSNVIQTMLGSGISFCFECGPGKVLSGINRRIERSLASKFLGTLTGMQSAQALLADKYSNSTCSNSV